MTWHMGACIAGLKPAATKAIGLQKAKTGQAQRGVNRARLIWPRGGKVHVDIWRKWRKI